MAEVTYYDPATGQAVTTTVNYTPTPTAGVTVSGAAKTTKPAPAVNVQLNDGTVVNLHGGDPTKAVVVSSPNATEPDKVHAGGSPVGKVETITDPSGTAQWKQDQAGNVINQQGKIAYGPLQGNRTQAEISKIVTGGLVGKNWFTAETVEKTVKLADNKLVRELDFMTLNKKYQDIGMNQGYQQMIDKLLNDGYKIKTESGQILSRNTAQEKKAPVIPVRNITIGPAKETLSDSQYKLKQLYDEQQAVSNLPWAERAKTRLWQQLTNMDYQPVIKLADGTYAKVSGGTAAALGMGGNPQTVITIAKIATALGAGYLTAQGIQQVKQAVEDYKDKTGEYPTSSNVVAVNDTGSAISITENGKLVYIPDLPSFKAEDLKGTDYSHGEIPALKGTDTSGGGSPALKGTSINVDKTPTIILDPLVSYKTDASDNYLKAAAAVDQAEAQLKTLAPEIDWNKELEKGKAARISRVFSETRNVSSPAYVRNRGIDAAYQEYIRRKQILDAARQSYVESMQPISVSGKISPAALYSLAAYRLYESINEKPIQVKTKTVLINNLQSDLLDDLNAISESQAREVTSINESTQSKTNQITSAAEVTRSAEASDTAEASNTGETTNTAEASDTAENARTNTRTAEATATAAADVPKIEPKTNQDEKALKGDKAVKPGTIAWEQGELKTPDGTKTVYKILPPPYDRTITSVGIPPAGYHDTGRTPAETIQSVNGPVKKQVDVPIGAVTAHAEPDSKKIYFTRSDGKVRITPGTEDNPKTRNRKPSVKNNNSKGKGRDLGAGVVRDRRGQHLKLY